MKNQLMGHLIIKYLTTFGLRLRLRLLYDFYSIIPHLSPKYNLDIFFKI